MAHSAAGHPRDRRRRSRDNAADPRPHSKSSAWSTSRPQGLRWRARCSARAVPSTAVWRAAMRFLHAGDHAGHRDRAGAVNVAVVLHARPREDVGRGARRSADSPRAASSTARACRSRSPRSGLRAPGRAPSRRRRRARSSRAPARRAQRWSRSRHRRSRRRRPAPRRRLAPPCPIARRRCRPWR